MLNGEGRRITDVKWRRGEDKKRPTFNDLWQKDAFLKCDHIKLTSEDILHFFPFPTKSIV
jgi:hypothetical protein